MPGFYSTGVIWRTLVDRNPERQIDTKKVTGGRLPANDGKSRHSGLQALLEEFVPKIVILSHR